MNENDIKNKKLLSVFNHIFLIIILIVVGFSVYFVVKDSKLSNDVQSSADVESGNSNNEHLQNNSVGFEEIDIIETNNDVEQLILAQPTKLNGFLSNPGIGWINRWGTKDLPTLPTTISYSDRSEIRWKDLNPEDGVYNWMPLDEQLNKAVSEGKQFSFRVYTMAGEEFGGQVIPSWVLINGAKILPSGEPDYSNCVYQEEWGRFVEALVNRYDGNPNIAFIDISGYGNFNEWSWRDDQTIWDETWEDYYQDGTAGPSTISNIDSQARRRLADMFVGGNYFGHVCRDKDYKTHIVDYDYPGFQETQLVMPYAGIIQSSQYVFTQRKDVGFRHDCWGRNSSEKILASFGDELQRIWPFAPVVFETCGADQFNMSSANTLLDFAHGSIIHNVNLLDFHEQEIKDLVERIGYRYFLSEIAHPESIIPGRDFDVVMKWLNIGNSPNYPKMGQRLELQVFLKNVTNGTLIKYQSNEDLSTWIPTSDPDSISQKVYLVEVNIRLPEKIEPGKYQLLVSIENLRTGLPINLAFQGSNGDGLYPVSTLEVIVD